MKAVPRFFPEMRLDEKLVKSDESGGTHKKPINWNQENIFYYRPMSALGGSYHIVEKVKEVTENH